MPRYLGRWERCPRLAPMRIEQGGRKRWHGRCSCSLLKFAPNRLKWKDGLHLLDLPGPTLFEASVASVSDCVSFNCPTLIDFHLSPPLINLPSPTTTFFNPTVCRPLPSPVPSRIESSIPSGLVEPQLANLNLYVPHHPRVPMPSPILRPNTSPIPSLPLPGDTTHKRINQL